MPVSGRFRLRMESRRAFLPFEILLVDLPSERPWVLNTTTACVLAPFRFRATQGKHSFL